MDYRVEKMPAFKVLGKVEKEMLDNVTANVFWKQCRKDGTLKTLTEYSTSADKEHIGIADGSSCDGESYMYYIVTPFEGDEIPEGYIVKEIPERLWIKFRCLSLGAKDTADSDLWRKIYSEFFPASDYEPSDYQAEVYPCGDGDYPNDISEVWISVNVKTKN